MKCPQCGSNAVRKLPVLKNAKPRIFLRSREFETVFGNKSIGLEELAEFYDVDEVCVGQCTVCGNFLFVLKDELVWPERPAIPPSKYLPEESRDAYMEAQRVIDRSARCACAMLRLALERLAIHLGADEKLPLARKIESLQIPERYRSLAEACRIVGNDAVHEGALDYRSDDSYELAKSLSQYINLLADLLIGAPAEADEIIEFSKAAKAKRKAKAKSLFSKFSSKLLKR